MALAFVFAALAVTLPALVNRWRPDTIEPKIVLALQLVFLMLAVVTIGFKLAGY